MSIYLPHFNLACLLQFALLVQQKVSILPVPLHQTLSAMEPLSQYTVAKHNVLHL